MYGADWCGDCRRTKAQLDGLGVPYDFVDLVVRPEAAETARAIAGRTNIPVVVYPDGEHAVEPTDAALAAKVRELGLA